jgi:pantoate--beta-alanine ligase
LAVGAGRLYSRCGAGPREVRGGVGAPRQDDAVPPQAPEERRQATVLNRSLREVERLVAAGEKDVAKLEQAMRVVLASAPLAQVDYASIVDAHDLQPVATIEGECLVAVAVKFGSTRLIDNTTIRT